MVTLLLLLYIAVVKGCTSIIFGRGATADGCPALTHNVDCARCDSRVAWVPRRDYVPGSRRPVFSELNTYFPRHIGYNRSSLYEPTAEYPEPFSPIAEVPQAPSTYALWEATLPMMNEYGLGMGESTARGKMEYRNYEKGQVDPRTNETGTAIFGVQGLMEIGMERCKTARCAIDTMGDFADAYGVAGRVKGLPESISIVDPEEAWVFEVHGDGAGGAVWAAKRIPDGHVAVLANNWIIDVLPRRPDSNWIRYSPNIEPTLRKNGLQSDDPHVLADFRKTFGVVANPRQRYTAPRIWRVFSKLAPSMKIDLPLDPCVLPFSVPVDRGVTLQEMIDLMSDHYSGTPLDLTKGVLAGPWQNPTRAIPFEQLIELDYSRPRSFSLMRTSYSFVVLARKQYPVVWYGPDAPATSVFVPFYGKTLTTGEMSPRFGTQTAPRLQVFDRDSAYWAFDFVANWMSINYGNMSEELVQPLRRKLQRTVFSACAEGERAATTHPDNATTILGAVQRNMQETVTTSWWQLADELIVRYHDFRYSFAKGKHRAVGTSEVMSYPHWYLRQIGMSSETYITAEHWSQPANSEAHERALYSSTSLPVPLTASQQLCGLLGCGVVSILIGFFAGQWSARRNLRRSLASGGEDRPFI